MDKSKKIDVIGVPWDANSSFQQGASEAPMEIFEVFQRGSLNKTCENGVLLEPGKNMQWHSPVDVDELNCVTELEQAFNFEHLLAIGGDHSVSYPLVKAAAKRHGKFSLLHIDAHPDLYNEFKGNRYSNACPMARIMEEGLVDRLVQVGIRTMNQHQLEQARRFGVEVVQMRDWQGAESLNLSGPFYVSLDVDGVDPAFAPGVSHREPGGLTTREVIDLICAIDGPVIGADIVEYNPKKDWDQMTAYVCVKLLKELAGKMLQG